MNELEQRVWTALQGRDGYIVHSKVRFADVINMDGGVWNDVQRSFGMKAHFDFVIADAVTSEPRIAIEMDGESHSDGAQQRRDARKDEICRAASFPLWRFSNSDLEKDDLPGWVAHVFDLWRLEEELEKTPRAARLPYGRSLSRTRTALYSSIVSAC